MTYPPLARWCRLFLLLLAAGAGTVRADWRADLSPPEPGAFPPLRAMTLDYDCGWEGVGAGRVAVQFSRPTPDTCLLDATAATTGIARMLWRMDATHEARGDMRTLTPLTLLQTEVYHYQTIRTELHFDPSGVKHLRQSTNDRKPARQKRYNFPNLFDIQTALLWVRSQKLETGDVYRIVVYPATTPYLATITVEGREQIKVKAGAYPAIRMDLKLEKVTSDMTLAPHGKFKRATGWLSDDTDRLPLRMNAQVFVGSVWVELAKVE